MYQIYEENSKQLISIRKIMLQGKEIERKYVNIFIENHILSFDKERKVYSIVYKENGLTMGFGKLQNKTLIIALVGIKSFNRINKVA